MATDWPNELDADDLVLDEDPIGAFYCPYTNRDECALITRRWQPQELCNALDCDQLKYFAVSRKRRGKAA